MHLENDTVNFQALKSPGKRKTGKCPGKLMEIFENT